MKRKTNLFYTSGPDSKFITFSNYTESLTGNFLSTDTKLFPDKFLCLKISNLHTGNTNTKAQFISYLAKYLIPAFFGFIINQKDFWLFCYICRNGQFFFRKLSLR